MRRDGGERATRRRRSGLRGRRDDARPERRDLLVAERRAVDFFAGDDVSLGLDVTYAASAGDAYAVDGQRAHEGHMSLGVGPQLGCNVPLGEVVSIWSRARSAAGASRGTNRW